MVVEMFRSKILDDRSKQKGKSVIFSPITSARPQQHTASHFSIPQSFLSNWPKIKLYPGPTKGILSTIALWVAGQRRLPRAIYVVTFLARKFPQNTWILRTSV